MDITTILKKELIKLDMKAETKSEALEELSNLLFKEGFISDVGLFLNDVYEREKEGETGLGGHIAIPHGKSEAVIRTSIAIGRTENHIPWESLDSQPVHCIILFAVRNIDKTTTHLKMLSQVAGALADDVILEHLLTEKDQEKIVQLFSEKIKL